MSKVPPLDKPRAARRTDVADRATTPSAHLSLPVGARVLDVLDVAYRARRPVLLEGPTGIGKSQIVVEFAARAGIDAIVLDLSLLEPPDLVGLPTIRDGRTHYASPAELPTSGRGVLILEELNRAEVPVMQPALQLLSARRLHAYELPPGWFCVASVNPEDGDYQVNRLDPALRARFLQLSVCADRDEWLRWATSRDVHPAVLDAVRDHADAFDDTPPRSWAYASELLHALRPAETSQRDLVRTVLRGYLSAPWALRVADALAGAAPTPALDVDALLDARGPAVLAEALRALSSQNRPDAVTAVASSLRRLFAGDAMAHAASAGRVTVASLERLVATLPGDLREQCLDALAEGPASVALVRTLDVDPAAVVGAGYAASGAMAKVRAWRESSQWHRGRLVVAGVLRALRTLDVAAHGALAGDAMRRAGLSTLADDMGPFGADLARWLRAHDLAVDAP